VRASSSGEREIAAAPRTCRVRILWAES
jgi:hypothetical protein